MMNNMGISGTVGLASIVLFVGAICGRAGAQSCVYLDQFNDSTPYPDWTPFTTDPSRIQVQEQNGRVEFWCPSENVGYEVFSAQISEGWKIDMSSDWAISVRYNILPPSPTYGEIGIGFVVAYEIDEEQPTYLTGYTLSAGISNTKGFDESYVVTRYWQNGWTEIQSNLYRSYTNETIYIWYDASSGCISYGDTLHIPDVTSCGLDTLSNLTTAFVGGVSYSFGYVPASNGSQLWADDFCLIYGAVVGPAVGACCVDGACVQTLESSCGGDWLGAGTSCGNGNDACNACAGDLTGDGAVDGADLNILLGDWGLSSSVADINEDGLVDGGDLNVLLGAWGVCP